MTTRRRTRAAVVHPTITDNAPSEPAAEGPMSECQRALGDCFETVEAEIDRLCRDRPEIDRPAVYFALTLGAVTRRGHEMFPPDWCADRDLAYENLKRAIDDVRRVYRRHPAAVNLETSAAGLEREYEALVAPERGQTFVAATRANLLRMANDRVSMGWVEPGDTRPRAVWRHEALAGLREAGIPISEATALLRVAGLSGRTPTPR